jgi:hypothetical protein
VLRRHLIATVGAAGRGDEDLAGLELLCPLMTFSGRTTIASAAAASGFKNTYLSIAVKTDRIAFWSERVLGEGLRGPFCQSRARLPPRPRL